MKYGMARKAPTGWKHEGWRACGDIPGMGTPRWFRCQRCNRIVSHGMIADGGCACGNRRLHAARGLTWPEIAMLKLGLVPLADWERRQVRPLFGGGAP